MIATAGGWSVVSSKVTSLEPQDLASTSWALARLAHVDGSFWGPLGEHVKACAGRLSAQPIANLAWSLAKVSHSGPVWSALAVEATRKMSEFACAEVSMTLWAFATGGVVHGSCPLFEVGRVVTRRRVAEFSSTSLANVSWAFAKCGQSGADERDLFASIRARTMDEQNFAGWEVATLTWAFVTVQVIDEGWSCDVTVCGQLGVTACGTQAFSLSVGLFFLFTVIFTGPCRETDTTGNCRLHACTSGTQRGAHRAERFKHQIDVAVPVKWSMCHQ